MKTYRSKIGPGIYIPVAFIIVGTGILLGMEQVVAGIVFVIIFMSFIAHMLMTTYYQVNMGRLRIKCGFFFDRTIDIKDIREIKPTRNPISSPANSMDRLLIKFNKHDCIMISPKEKAAFINDLLEYNPSIIVVQKRERK